jgi:hypothetical protein
VSGRRRKLFLVHCPLLTELRLSGTLEAYWVPVPRQQLGLSPVSIRRTGGGVAPADAFARARKVDLLTFVPFDRQAPDELDAVCDALAFGAPPKLEIHSFVCEAPVQAPFMLVLVRKPRRRYGLR